jgi:very-short-patch-repair endonuclease
MIGSGARAEGPALRLARYLKEFVGLRTTTVRDLAKYESVLWFADMPQDAGCRSPAWSDSRQEDEPWLEVKRQEPEPLPDPPEIAQPWVDLEALKQATLEIPPLRSTILAPDPDVDPEEGETPPLIALSLFDFPEVERAYDMYRPRWEAWSTEARRRRKIQEVYAALFSLHTQIRKQGEILEVVVGLGLLDWRATKNERVIPIRRHAMVARAEIEFDPAKGVIRVISPGEGATLLVEDDMLEPEVRPDRTHYAALQMQLDEIGNDIWDRPRLENALKYWATSLHADSQWFPDLQARPGVADRLVASLAPALILRKRLQTGMVRIYDALIDQLSREPDAGPSGWKDLIDDSSDFSGGQPEGRAADGDRSTPDPNSEIYFPLPANREQCRIVEAIGRHRGVLVQGPPGTGKSHTIANLVCHLLATGQRVLITAETSRALQVIKEKLPKEIQALCVSLLGQGGDSFAELNASIQAITTKQAAYSPSAYDGRIAELERDLDHKRRRLAAIDSEIRSLREGETCTHNVAAGAYKGTASAIAERLAREREQFSWLKIMRDAPPRPLVTTEELLDWLAVCRRYTDSEVAASKLQAPPSSTLPAPRAFAAAVSSEAESRSRAASADFLRGHAGYEPLRALAPKSRAALREELVKLEQERLALGSFGSDWRREAVDDLFAGRRARWVVVADVSRQISAKIEHLLARIGDRDVAIPATLDARRVRDDAAIAVSHLGSGGRWTRFGFFTPPMLKGRTYLRTRVQVDGHGASDYNSLQAVVDFLDLESAMSELHAAWLGVGAVASPGHRRVRYAMFQEQARTLGRLIDFALECDRVAISMAASPRPVPIPMWLAGEAQQWIDMIDAADLAEEFAAVQRSVDQTTRVLENVRNLHDAHPLVSRLVAAAAARDVTEYSKHYETLVEIEAARDAHQRRGRIESQLTAIAPGLIESVLAALPDPVWDERLGAWQNAWAWAVADSWIEKRADLPYQQDLWRRRGEIEGSIRSLLAEVAALRAWTHFFARLAPRQSAALKSWRQAVQAMGKGTGSSAKMGRLRHEARRYMDICRDAIPVWIMPRYLVAEMMDPAPGRYDMVIADEASQLGIESLFLFYVAKKMIVVGDDQQISPSGVGVADAAIAGLQKQFLDGVPHHHALSPQSSVYGNAKIRFGSNIVLREHFRCMPEIIQFSNDLCYANNGTPLDPLRTYSPNRLQPLVLRHVGEGYRTGSTHNAINPPEADAIVAQIVSCVRDPRYAGATIGVISLQGEAQAKRIEQMLLEVLDPKIIEERRIICGDAYAFQGDERTVIFLSMVAAPGDARIGTLSTESARQRFNVAVSRAQDQIWLFYTAGLDMLSNACMRHRLLSYMLEPSRKPADEGDQSFDSEFERAVFRLITARGFHVRTQVCVGDTTNHRYRIDLVVEGMQGRLAVECDGDQWHGLERYEQDMARQRDLERAGWEFVRIRGGEFYRDPTKALEPLWAELHRMGIEPGGINQSASEPPPPVQLDGLTNGNHQAGGEPDEEGEEDSAGEEEGDSVQLLKLAEVPSGGPNDPAWPPGAEVGTPSSSGSRASPPASRREPDRGREPTPKKVQPLLALPELPRRDGLIAYSSFEGTTGPDPRQAGSAEVVEGLRRIIAIEGPMLTKRAYDIYLRGCGIRSVGRDIKHAMNKALQLAVRRGAVLSEDESGKGGLLYSIVRSSGIPPVIARERGPRSLDEIPPSELQLIVRRLCTKSGIKPGSDASLRATLEFLELKNLTTQVGSAILAALQRRFSYVDELLRE